MRPRVVRSITIGAVTAALTSALTLIFGCASTATLKQPAYVPTFKFTPPAAAAPGSAGVAFAIVNARYSKEETWTKRPPFTTFAGNMSADFQELLNARGFTVRGPFTSVDEMTFPDKKGADLTLQPTLDLTLGLQSKGVEEKVNILTANTYVEHLVCTVEGRVTFAITEPLSGERMWFKNVAVAPTTVEVGVPAAAGQSRVSAGDLDFSTSSELARALDRTYATVLETAWKYLDPAEIALVKKQGDEIRAKKVY